AQVSEKIRRISTKILEDAKKEDVHVGKNPIGLAAASVYISSIGNGKDISMASLSRKSNISTVTIRKLVKMLKPFAAKYIETIDITQ
ncbi:MAG: transcription factor TFIIB, partial [Nitrosopumilaceae archaeon]|nr:transcription factor TFIIB [Nitrosopumilaceae archaeon]